LYGFPVNLLNLREAMHPVPAVYVQHKFYALVVGRDRC
jgi:hypothetical protein